jgi:hypothetical protein
LKRLWKLKDDGAPFSFCALNDSSSKIFSEDLIFKLVEEENPALLLHLPKLFAETTDFGSVFSLGCCLVVAAVQAAVYGKTQVAKDF